MARLFGLGRKTFKFRCPDCGEMHRGSPSIAYDRPLHHDHVPEAERAERVELTSDTCLIRPPVAETDTEAMYFIRGVLEVPIADVDEPFTWGLWVSQSQSSFERYRATFGHDQSGDGSFGWLTVSMRPYLRHPAAEPLEYLACNVPWQPKGRRPLIEIKPCDHPLYLDQRDGISWDRAIEIARQALHGA
jgi:hypothetical protein